MQGRTSCVIVRLTQRRSHFLSAGPPLMRLEARRIAANVAKLLGCETPYRSNCSVTLAAWPTTVSIIGHDLTP